MVSVESRSVARRCAVSRCKVRTRDASSASRAADVVVGERRRPRQQIADGRGDRAACRSATRRGAGRRTGSTDRSRARRPSYEARSVPSAIVDRDVGVRERAVEQLGARQASAAGQRQRRGARAGAVDAEVPGDGAGVARVLQPADVEPLAEAMQIDAGRSRRRRCSGSAAAACRSIRSCRAPIARAEELGRRERRACRR